jgi:CheY-like chemotaxis protein
VAATSLRLRLAKRRLGYTVLTAVDDIAALSLKQQRDIGHIDLLLTDVVMPHMSGKELGTEVQIDLPQPSPS